MLFVVGRGMLSITGEGTHCCRERYVVYHRGRDTLL